MLRIQITITNFIYYNGDVLLTVKVVRVQLKWLS